MTNDKWIKEVKSVLATAPEGMEFVCMEKDCSFRTKDTVEAMVHSNFTHNSEEFGCELRTEIAKSN